MTAPPKGIRHAFTVDVEDWYHGIPIPGEDKALAERRLERGVHLLLDLLAERDTRATFFVLGPAAAEHPVLIRRIANAGHEIGCHGWAHELIYRMTPGEFREDTHRAMSEISNITGSPVTTFRAAYFSITKDSLWALEVLASLGFRSDSSIFPVHNWRYGIADFEPRPHRIETPTGSIFEFPLTTRKVFGQNLPVSGGAYLRIYPYSLTRSNFLALESVARPVIFYIHPWEFDPDHPRVSFHWKARFTHYVNLGSTEKKVRQLLAEFRFGSLGDLMDDEQLEAGSRAL